MAAFAIFPARSVITMNPAQPRAEAVAVRDGHILAVGAVDEMARWGDHTIDDRFRDAYVMAGHVEAHSHVFAGSLWAFPYVGYYPRTDPRGQRWEGCQSLDAVIERLADLSAAMEDPAEPLIAWGLDPIYFPGERLLARHLDRASSERPIFVYHVSGHLATVNGAALRRAGITAEEGIEGIMLEDGRPNGELREPRAMLAAGDYLARIGRAAMTDSAIRDFGAERGLHDGRGPRHDESRKPGGRRALAPRDGRGGLPGARGDVCEPGNDGRGDAGGNVANGRRDPRSGDTEASLPGREADSRRVDPGFLGPRWAAGLPGHR